MICSPWRYQLTAAVWPPFPGVTSCLLILRKGAAHEYIRSSSTLPCHHRYLQPVHSGKKKLPPSLQASGYLLTKWGANRLPVAPLSIFIIAISFVMSSFALHRAVPRRVAGNCSFYRDLLALIGTVQERHTLSTGAAIGGAERGSGRAVGHAVLHCPCHTAPAQKESAATSVKPLTVLGAVPSARYRNVTLCPRVQVLLTPKVPSAMPLVTPS